jgi:hypothetical protein
MFHYIRGGRIKEKAAEWKTIQQLAVLNLA